jgi:hypothetical protein
MDPEPCKTMWRSSARTHNHVPRRFTRIWVSKSSSVTSPVTAPRPAWVPATFAAPSGVRDVRPQELRLAAGLAHEPGGHLAADLVDIADHHRRPSPAERNRRRPPDARRPACAHRHRCHRTGF